MNPANPDQPPRQTPEGVPSRKGDHSPSPVAGTVAGPSTTGSSSTSASRRKPAARIDLLDATIRLAARDLVLSELLDAHHTLTTSQISDLLFGSHSGASRRLYQLRAIGWINRFIPVRASGRLETHWVLDQLGAQWAAPRAGRTPPTVKAGRERRAAIAASTQLEHTDGTNQVFVDLLTAARHNPSWQLKRWWSPARTASALGQRVHPDGHGVWAETNPSTGHTAETGFFLEYDTGTETLDRLRDKLEPYRRLRRDGGPDYPVLFWLPGPAREANFHRKLNGSAAHLEITLATTSPAAVHAAHAASGEGITGRIWKIAGNGRTRHRLTGLPSRHGQPGAPYHPGAPSETENPFHLLALRCQ